MGVPVVKHTQEKSCGWQQLCYHHSSSRTDFIATVSSGKTDDNASTIPLTPSTIVCISHPLHAACTFLIFTWWYRLCGLVVRIPGYRSRGPAFDSWRYQIFWEVVGLEWGPLSLVRIIEELLEWKSSGSGQDTRINGRADTLHWPHDTLYPQKLALTSPPSGGRSVGIVRLRTKGHGV
jgi:hypothetical protein